MSAKPMPLPNAAGNTKSELDVSAERAARSTEIWLAGVFWTLLVVLLLLHALFALQHRFWFPYGDPAKRIMGYLLCADDYGRYLQSLVTSGQKFFGDAWPFGPYIIQGAFIKTLYGLGITSTAAVFPAIQLFSLAFVFLGIVTWRRAVLITAGPIPASLFGMFLLGYSLILRNNFTGMSEVYAFLFVGLGIYTICKYVRGPGIGKVLVAAFFLLLASTCRSEMFAPAFAITLYLACFNTLTVKAEPGSRGTSAFLRLWWRRLRDAFIFGLVSTSYFVGRLVYSLLYVADPADSVFNFLRPYHADPEQNAIYMRRLQEELYFNLGPWFLLFAILVVLSTAIFTYMKKQSEHKKRERLKCFALFFLLSTVHLALLLYMEYSGTLTYVLRYWLLPSTSLGAVAIMIIGWTVADGIKAGFVKTAHTLAAIYVFFAIGLGVFYVDQVVGEAVTGIEPEVRDVIAWLDENNKEGRPTSSDFLMWRGTTMSLYLQPELAEGNPSYPSCTYPMPTLPPEFRGRYKAGLAVTWLTHQHLALYKPSYVILIDHDRYEKDRVAIVAPDFTRVASHYWPFLKEDESGQHTFRFESPYLDQSEKIYLDFAYKNDLFEIYRVDANQGAWHSAEEGADIERFWVKDRKLFNRVQAGEAFEITLQPGASMYRVDSTPLKKGDTITASAWLWSDTPTETKGLTLIVMRHDRGVGEGAGTEIDKLGSTPQAFQASYTFRNPHDAVRIQIKNGSEHPLTFKMASPSLNRE